MSYKAMQADASDVLVDLSPYWEKLQAYEDISDDLSEDDELKLLDYIRICGKLSYDRISRRYDHWKEADRAHDVWVPPEATKFREKAVISDTRAVADTVLTYLMSALAGRNPMFQLEGLNRKSKKPALILERLLHQHMRRTAGEARVAQIMLDSIRYGFAPSKLVWNVNDNTNNIVNFDPRRVFPDPRVNWGDWDRMQYVIFTDFCSTSALLAGELYPKLHKYPGLRVNMTPSNGWEIHDWVREEGKGLNINPKETTDASGDTFYSLDQARTVDEMWVRFNGYEIGLPGINQVWMVVSAIDERAIIRLQLSPVGRQFPVVFGGLYFDKHKTFSQSLYDVLMPIHDVATWLLRSRIDNVQASLNSLIFVDPTQVNVADLIDRNPWGVVQTLPGVAPGEGVYITDVPDVTKSHWQDIAALSDLKQRVSAASDTQQGLPTSDGIRSATEIQRLSQLGSQRLGVLSRIMSATTIRPMVRMSVSNLQDALNFDGSIRMSPNSQPGPLQDLIEEDYLDFDVNMLQGDIDYLVVDGSLPIEPERNAETWMTMLQVLNQTGLIMEYKAGKIAEEAIRAMGVSDIDQFKISPEEASQGPSPSQELALLEKARGASVQPQDQIEAEAQKGNVISMREAMGMPQ